VASARSIVEADSSGIDVANIISMAGHHSASFLNKRFLFTF